MNSPKAQPSMKKYKNGSGSKIANYRSNSAVKSAYSSQAGVLHDGQPKKLPGKGLKTGNTTAK